jgi:hypothetical protein
MQNGQKNTRFPRSAAYAGRSKQWTASPSRQASNGSYNAQKNYERYLALAQAEAQAGDRVAAEGYYQHAEHFLRMMSSDKGAT